MSNAQRYDMAARAVHWATAALIIALVVVGWYMTGLPKEDAGRPAVYGLHKSIGMVTLLLLAGRLVWLRLHPAPVLPAAFSAGEQRVTKGVQAGLYLLMALVPVTGYVMSQAAGHPVGLFGLIQLPTLVDANKELAGVAHEMHEVLSYSMLLLLALHVAGAVKHRLLDKGGEKDVLARML